MIFQLRDRRGHLAHSAAVVCLCMLVTGPASIAASPPAFAQSASQAPAIVLPNAQSSSPATVDLPHYDPPPSFSEEVVIHSRGETLVMKRAIDQGRLRTDMTMDGQSFTMIELGDEKGTFYVLMPDEKRAMKMSRQGVGGTIGSKPDVNPDAAPEEEFHVENLGDELVEGVMAGKMRLTSKDGDVTCWFDKTTGAPHRMEGKVQGEPANMEWKNRQVAPQPASLFEVPKNYETMDMDAMMAQMGDMSAMMKGMPGGMPGMPGMPLGGMMGGMGGIKGMAGGMAGPMGENLGGTLGATVGGALGGPIGSIAGRYLGRRVGGMLTRKVVNAVM